MRVCTGFRSLLVYVDYVMAIYNCIEHPKSGKMEAWDCNCTPVVHVTYIGLVCLIAVARTASNAFVYLTCQRLFFIGKRWNIKPSLQKVNLLNQVQSCLVILYLFIYFFRQVKKVAYYEHRWQYILGTYVYAAVSGRR